MEGKKYDQNGALPALLFWSASYVGSEGAIPWPFFAAGFGLIVVAYNMLLIWSMPAPQNSGPKSI